MRRKTRKRRRSHA